MRDKIVLSISRIMLYCITFTFGQFLIRLKITTITVADLGFPAGADVDLVGGAVDSRGGYVSKILYVKMKASGP